MEKYIKLKEKFELHANPENALAMKKYMRDLFEFYGIPTPERKSLYGDFLKEEKKKRVIDWELLDMCYEDNHREFQYFVYDYLLAMKKYVTYEDINRIKKYILSKSWWDTIDFLCKVIGDIGLRDKRVKDLMQEWSKDDNIWIKRTAILHQLGLKEKTDTILLAKILVNNFNSNEFFVNKAIGWALREYSKTNHIWVQEFINKYQSEMHSLSIKEASKYI